MTWAPSGKIALAWNDATWPTLSVHVRLTILISIFWAAGAEREDIKNESTTMHCGADMRLNIRMILPTRNWEASMGLQNFAFFYGLFTSDGFPESYHRLRELPT